MTRDLAADLDLALQIVEKVDRYTLEHFRAHDFQVSQKPDLTPVSDVDQRAEQMIREALAHARPEDGIYGEEYGEEKDEDAAGRKSETQPVARWVIDPIDGTKNFVRGLPVWATLLALEIEGEAKLGVVSAPALERRWWAYAGSDAFLQVDSLHTSGVEAAKANAKKLQVSQVDQVADASFSYSSLTGWAARKKLEDIVGLTQEVWRTRAYGDFWSYMLVAEGVVDAAAEPELEVYDMAALVPIVKAAGGTFTGLDGRDGHHSGNAIATNGHLHEKLLKRLGD